MTAWLIAILCFLLTGLPASAQSRSTGVGVPFKRVTYPTTGTNNGMASLQQAEGTASLQLPELLPRERELELALSAAPEHLRKAAAVFVLQRGGYVKAREGSNGFTCIVEREGVKGIAPVCFDQEGSETTLLMAFRKARLAEEGKNAQEVERIIDDDYRTGKLLAPRKPGIAYMLSSEFKVHDHKSGQMASVFPPHLMFYAPYRKNSDIGARSEDFGSQSRPWILNEGKAYAYIIVVPQKGERQ
jgi:hypothetical protein